MRDVVVTPATRRTRPRRRRAAPRPSLPSRPHSFHAFLAGARNDSLKKKPPRQPANYPSLSRFANRAFSFHALERTSNSRTTARKAIAKVFAVKAAAVRRRFCRFAREVPINARLVSFIGGISESRVRVGARLSSFPLIRASFRVTRVMKGVFPSNVAWDVRVATHEPRAYRH